MEDRLFNKINEMSSDELKNIIENSDMYSAEAVELATERLRCFEETKTEVEQESGQAEIELPETADATENIEEPKKRVQNNGPFVAYAKMFKNYVNFKGRSSRADYWYVQLMNCIISLLFEVMLIPPAAYIISALVNNTDCATLQIITFACGIALFAVWTITIFIPSLALLVRRLHDTGKSGWWYFIYYVPFVGSIILFVLMLIKGDENENKYGENPRYSTKKVSSTWLKICFVLLVLLTVISTAVTVISEISFDSNIFAADTLTQQHAEGNVKFIDIDGNVILDKYDVVKAETQRNEQGWCVAITFNKAGQEKFTDATERISADTDGRNVIYIYVDDYIVSAPTVAEPITGESVIINGGLTKEDAEVLARQIMYASTDYNENDYYDDEEQEAENLISEESFEIIRRVETNYTNNVAVESPQYNTYRNNTFGIEIEYPTHFSEVLEQNGQNQHYKLWENADGSAILCVNVTDNVYNVTPEEIQADLIEMYDGEVTYSPVKDEWFALSINDEVFYHYAYYRVENGYIKGFEFHFAGKDNLPIYSKYIDDIFASFKRF